MKNTIIIIHYLQLEDMIHNLRIVSNKRTPPVQWRSKTVIKSMTGRDVQQPGHMLKSI